MNQVAPPSAGYVMGPNGPQSLAGYTVVQTPQGTFAVPNNAMVPMQPHQGAPPGMGAVAPTSGIGKLLLFATIGFGAWWIYRKFVKPVPSPAKHHRVRANSASESRARRSRSRLLSEFRRFLETPGSEDALDYDGVGRKALGPRTQAVDTGEPFPTTNYCKRCNGVLGAQNPGDTCDTCRWMQRSEAADESIAGTPEAIGKECARCAIEQCSAPIAEYRDADGNELCPSEPPDADYDYLADQLGRKPDESEEREFKRAFTATIDTARAEGMPPLLR